MIEGLALNGSDFRKIALVGQAV
ncbi:hypothetical protein CMALT430_30159 [Carnobacterium maltaromaticum]|nr:hypothetical protein CMALT430_30159 [Carnobacterium maltaromaticum]